MKPVAPKPQRCAIYTRKSTEHNLDLAFNSLDAQREACEAYIKSQAHEGWRLVPDRYDDAKVELSRFGSFRTVEVYQDAAVAAQVGNGFHCDEERSTFRLVAICSTRAANGDTAPSSLLGRRCFCREPRYESRSGSPRIRHIKIGCANLACALHQSIVFVLSHP